MQKLKNYKLTIPLTPVQLIWLHSQHYFMKVEQETRTQTCQIKFYKVNAGVEIRFETVGEEPDYTVPQHAKQEIEAIIRSKQIRQLDVSFVREVYLRVARETRKQFPQAYIIFLHYETFENCCRKLKEKFGVTSAHAEFQRLRGDNRHFCFLICQREWFMAVYKYTQKLLNMEISCASTSISNKRDRGSLQHDAISLSKRAHSVTSLRGSFTSCDNDTHTEPQQRLSLNCSQAGQEIYQIGQAVVHNLDKVQLNSVVRTRRYQGSPISVQYCQGSYLDIKKRLYYANRLQMFPNPYIQQVFAYGIGHNMGSWWAYFITGRTTQNLREAINSTYWQQPRRKVLLVLEICKAVEFLHRNRQTHGHICPETVKLDGCRRILLCGTPNKNIPPHTNPFEYDIRLLMLLVYWVATSVQLSYQSLAKKIAGGCALFTMPQRARHLVLLQFYRAGNDLIRGVLDLHGYIDQLQKQVDV